MPPRLSVAIITLNEEANLARTLTSLKFPFLTEIVIVDSGSTDATLSIAAEHKARILHQPWLGFSAQKNFALDSCTGDWLLSLDADEELSPHLAAEISTLLMAPTQPADAFFIPRINFFLGRPICHGGYFPDRKLRLLRNTPGAPRFTPTLVHETISANIHTANLDSHLLHHAYPSLSSYIQHMDTYSTLGARQASPSRNPFAFITNVLLNPLATFVKNYIFRAGCLDGREGLLLHLYHSVYVSWKYAKAWESTRK